MQRSATIRCAACTQPGALIRCPVCKYTPYCSPECLQHNADLHSFVCYPVTSNSLELAKKLYTEKTATSSVYLPATEPRVLDPKLAAATAAPTVLAFIAEAQAKLVKPCVLDVVLCELYERMTARQMLMVRFTPGPASSTEAETIAVSVCPADRRELCNAAAVVRANACGMIPYVCVTSLADTDDTALAFHCSAMPRKGSGVRFLPQCNHVLGGSVLITVLPGPEFLVSCPEAYRTTIATGKDPDPACYTASKPVDATPGRL